MDKSRVYFNPDNSVVILEPNEDSIFQWIKERGAQLKEAKFFLNAETAQQIKEHLEGVHSEIAKAEIQEVEVAIPEVSVPNTKALVAAEAVGNDARAKEKKEILKQLKGKQTVATLTDIVVRLAKLV